jgi:hypothetical protein
MRSPSLGLGSVGPRALRLGALRLGSLRLGSLRLGSVNLALLSLYFIPAWGRDAIRALLSPYNGLEDRAQAAAASYFGQLLDLGFGGLVLTSHILAGIKLVIAAAFVAYVIEFARAWVIGRDADRETIDVVLILAVANIVISTLPALALGDAALVRLYATQMLLLAGAITIIVVERHLARDRHLAPEANVSQVATAALEIGAAPLPLPVGELTAGPPPASVAAALARIPEQRLHHPPIRSSAAA